jgi:hypothetical protein
MWTTKEVLFISIATGLAFSFATIYSQRKLKSYIDQKLSEKSGNPLLGIVSQPPINDCKEIQYQLEKSTFPVQEAPLPASIEPQIMYQAPPEGSGSRWTPLPIS